MRNGRGLVQNGGAGQTGRIRAKMDTSKVGTGLLLRAVTFSSNTAEKQQGVMPFWGSLERD